MGNQDLDSLIPEEIFEQVPFVLLLKLSDAYRVVNFCAFKMVDFDARRLDVLEQ